jgi:hypothetical protein
VLHYTSFDLIISRRMSSSSISLSPKSPFDHDSTFHLPAMTTHKSSSTSIPHQDDALAQRPQTMWIRWRHRSSPGSAGRSLTFSEFFPLVQCTSAERCDPARRGNYVSRCARDSRGNDELIAFVSPGCHRDFVRWLILGVFGQWYAPLVHSFR